MLPVTGDAGRIPESTLRTPCLEGWTGFERNERKVHILVTTNGMLTEMNFSKPMEPGGFALWENGHWLSFLHLSVPADLLIALLRERSWLMD